MNNIRIKTQVDITNTNQRRVAPGFEKESNQYKNYITLLQTIGLRGNFTVTKEPEYKNKMWVMEIEPERPGTYAVGDDPVGLLKQDLDAVPVITGLEEKVKNPEKCMRTLNGDANTFVELVS